MQGLGIKFNPIVATCLSFCLMKRPAAKRPAAAKRAVIKEAKKRPAKRRQGGTGEDEVMAYKVVPAVGER